MGYWDSVVFDSLFKYVLMDGSFRCCVEFMFCISGGGFQRLRAHLYGSLLYYLQIAQKPEEPDTLQTGRLDCQILVLHEKENQACSLNLFFAFV